MTKEEEEHLQNLRDEMEIARLNLIEFKVAFDKACDAVYLYARQFRKGSQ